MSNNLLKGKRSNKRQHPTNDDSETSSVQGSSPKRLNMDTSSSPQTSSQTSANLNPQAPSFNPAYLQASSVPEENSQPQSAQQVDVQEPPSQQARPQSSMYMNPQALPFQPSGISISSIQGEDSHDSQPCSVPQMDMQKSPSQQANFQSSSAQQMSMQTPSSQQETSQMWSSPQTDSHAPSSQRESSQTSFRPQSDTQESPSAQSLSAQADVPPQEQDNSVGEFLDAGDYLPQGTPSLMEAEWERLMQVSGILEPPSPSLEQGQLPPAPDQPISTAPLRQDAPLHAPKPRRWVDRASLEQMVQEESSPPCPILDPESEEAAIQSLWDTGVDALTQAPFAHVDKVPSVPVAVSPRYSIYKCFEHVPPEVAEDMLAITYVRHKLPRELDVLLNFVPVLDVWLVLPDEVKCTIRTILRQVQVWCLLTDDMEDGTTKFDGGLPAHLALGRERVERSCNLASRMSFKAAEKLPQLPSMRLLHDCLQWMAFRRQIDGHCRLNGGIPGMEIWLKWIMFRAADEYYLAYSLMWHNANKYFRFPFPVLQGFVDYLGVYAQIRGDYLDLTCKGRKEKGSLFQKGRFSFPMIHCYERLSQIPPEGDFRVLEYLHTLRNIFKEPRRLEDPAVDSNTHEQLLEILNTTSSLLITETILKSLHTFLWHLVCLLDGWTGFENQLMREFLGSKVLNLDLSSSPATSIPEDPDHIQTIEELCIQDYLKLIVGTMEQRCPVVL